MDISSYLFPFNMLNCAVYGLKYNAISDTRNNQTLQSIARVLQAVILPIIVYGGVFIYIYIYIYIYMNLYV